MRPFNITVNKKPVPMTDHRVTGLQVKEAAIAAGVDIELDFQLSIRRPNGRLEVVGDDDKIAIVEKSEFRAVAPDDNS
ncbi:MAG: multiubiquitin domain-containing protein [Acidimicrobiales bacterium]|nr:multiubiquitin domain-containing protein [Acidimicrobiales bacterium]